MASNPNNPILDLVAQYRAALENYDKKALGRLVDAYGRMYGRLQDKIDLLVNAIGEEAPTLGQLTRMRRYKELMAQIEDELRGFQAILGDEIAIVGRDNIIFAGRDAQRMLQTIGSEYGVNVGFNRLPTDAIETLLGFLSPQGPLYERIGQLAGTYAQEVADAIAEGVGLGYNPRKVAGLIRDKLGGGLTDALRMTRTVQLWSYRESTRANYINNADVVEGWIWHAHLAGDPCMACIAQHGSFHTLDETLDDHHNGRCAMIPVVRGFPPIVEGNGQKWFEQLPEAKQRELMGKGKFEAWKEGKFDFSQLIGKHTDGVYGDMTVEQTLKGLVGGGESETINGTYQSIPTLSKEQFEALRDYQVSDYRWINEELRTGEGINEESRQYHRLLDGAIDSAGRTIKDITSYRGIEDDFLRLSPGDEFLDKGYISTSTKRNTVQTFLNASTATDEGRTPAVMKITIPRGSRGLYMDDIYDFDEKEFLLPRNTRFRVKSVGVVKIEYYDDIIDVLQYELEAISG